MYKQFTQNKYDRHVNMTVTDLQAIEFDQAQNKCGEDKHVCKERISAVKVKLRTLLYDKIF